MIQVYSQLQLCNTFLTVFLFCFKIISSVQILQVELRDTQNVNASNSECRYFQLNIIIEHLGFTLRAADNTFETSRLEVIAAWIEVHTRTFSGADPAFL